MSKEQTIKEARHNIQRKLKLLENEKTNVVSFNRFEGELLIETIQQMIKNGEI